MINVIYKIDAKPSVKLAIMGKLSNGFNPILQGIYASHNRNELGIQVQELRSIEREIETWFNLSGARRYGKIVSVIHYVPPLYEKTIPIVTNPNIVMTCEITLEMTNDEAWRLKTDSPAQVELSFKKYNHSIFDTTNDSFKLPDRMVLADGLDSINTPLMPEEATEFDLLEDSSTPLMPLKNAWE